MSGRFCDCAGCGCKPGSPQSVLARHYPEATGTSWILSALSISAKIIAAHVRRARLDDVLGSVGSENVQGEQQQELDVIANEILRHTSAR